MNNSDLVLILYVLAIIYDKILKENLNKIKFFFQIDINNLIESYCHVFNNFLPFKSIIHAITFQESTDGSTEYDVLLNFSLSFDLRLSFDLGRPFYFNY